MTDTVATGKVGFESPGTIGATHYKRAKKGQTTVYYEVGDAGELSGDLVIGPLVDAAVGGELTGKARIAVTVDSHGKPLTLSVINTSRARSTAA